MTVLSHCREYRQILIELSKVVWSLTGNDEIILFELKVMFCDGFKNSNAKFYRNVINRINFTSPSFWYSILMCSHNIFSFVIISSKNNSFVTFDDSYLVKGFWSRRPPLLFRINGDFSSTEVYLHHLAWPSVGLFASHTYSGRRKILLLIFQFNFATKLAVLSCGSDMCAHTCNSVELLLSFALSVFLLFWYIVSNLALSSSGRKFTPKVSPVEVWQLYVINKELYLSSTNAMRTYIYHLLSYSIKNILSVMCHSDTVSTRLTTFCNTLF